MTGWFLCCLPFFVFGLISVVNPDYERLLWTSPIGVRLIYGALALMFLGVYTIRKIIGPESAGADPGPVCYGRGGTGPTVTDANLVLGRLDPSEFLGGEMGLDVEAARAAIRTRIGEPLGLPDVEAALAIVKIAVLNMSLAVRQVSVERGYDPRDFAMVAFGGAGRCTPWKWPAPCIFQPSSFRIFRANSRRPEC